MDRLKTNAPDADAVALLDAPSPVLLLADWLQHLQAAQLARVLHAAVALLKSRGPSEQLRYFPIDLRHGGAVHEGAAPESPLHGGRAVHLDLLLLPSIFAPEVWSYTFLEGLLQKPLHEYAGKRLIELGTGSGWVSLALLRLTRSEHILGLDLNPEAVVMARVNALLNSFDAAGRPDADRLYERFSAQESDLLAAPRARHWTADFVLGCIPQVIATAGEASDSARLYDLSNYFAAQGLVEDKFGLGLNARALREALSSLRPGGSVILNLAGRPGPAVVAHMFERRGYRPRVLWQARVEQAADTNIAPLVELEEQSGKLFAYHLHRSSLESISARLALAAQQSGLLIYHELQVIEGKPCSEILYDLARSLDGLALQSLWEEVDLSRASDEQLRFVTRLAQTFEREARAPYPHEAGDPSFRLRVGSFLHKFHDLTVDPEEIFVAPSRAQLFYGLLLALVEPAQPVAVSASLRAVYERPLARYGVRPLWVHGDASELAELLPIVRPRILLLAAPSPLRQSRPALELLLAGCERAGCLLVLDESEHFAISCQVVKNPVLSFLGAHLGSPNLAVLIGLVHSQAFPDVELALGLLRHPALMEALGVAAEVTYSRLSWFHQDYYASLFDELLSFQVQGAAAHSPVRAQPRAQGRPALQPQIKKWLQIPAFARPAPAADVIRLDYGENELPLPASVVTGILMGFLDSPEPGEPGGAELGRDARRAALGYLRATRLPALEEDELCLGQGAMPLLFDALAAEKLRRGGTPRVLLPQGCYGMTPPLIEAAGCAVVQLPTQGPEFIADSDRIADSLQFEVLLLTNPANPSGAAYSPARLRALIEAAAARGARVILDEVFGLLANLDSPPPWGEDRLQGLSEAVARQVLLLCSASKEVAAGGLRLGVAATTDKQWLQLLQRLAFAPLPRSAEVAARFLFAALPSRRAEIEAMRAQLLARRRRLEQGLTELGFRVDTAGRGGLFVLADVSPLAAGDPERFVLELEARARVRLNTPSWCGLQDHARACFAIAPDKLEEALRRLKRHLQG